MIHSSAKSINRQKAIFFLDIRVSPTVHTDQPKMLLAAKRATSSAVQLTESIVKTVVLEPATELGFAVHDVARDVLSVADDVADALEEAATDALSKHASAVLSSDGGAEVSGADAATHARLVAVYTEHNPSKLPAVPALVAKWRGREAQLFDALTTKYHLQQKPPALVAGGASATETAAVALSPVQQQTSHLRKRAGSTPGASPLSERTNEQQQQRVPMAPHTPATSRTAPATQAAAVATAAATTRRQEVGGAAGSSTGHGGVAGIDLEALTFAQLMQLIEGELGLDPSLRPRESLELAREVLGLSGGAGSPGMVGGGASSLSLRDEALRVSGSGTPPPSSGAPLSCACSLHRSLPHSLTHSLRRTLVCRLLGSSCPVVECSCSLPLRRHHSCRRWAVRSGSRRRMVTRGAEAEVMMSRPHSWWAHPAPHSRSRRAAAAAARPSWRRSCVDVRYKPPTHLEPGSPRAVGRGGSCPARAIQPHSHAQQVRCLCCIGRAALRREVCGAGRKYTERRHRHHRWRGPCSKSRRRGRGRDRDNWESQLGVVVVGGGGDGGSGGGGGGRFRGERQRLLTANACKAAAAPNGDSTGAWQRWGCC
jgi:hypothetical protein